MSEKQAKRLRRLEKAVEGIHGRTEELICGAYGQDTRLSNVEHNLNGQDARLKELEGSLEGLVLRVDKLDQDAEFTEKLLDRAYAGRKMERKRAEAYKTDMAMWKSVAAVAVCVAAAIALMSAAAISVKGDGIHPDTQVQIVPEPPAVVRTVQTIQAAPEPVEENENERIEAALLARAHVIENCKVTYYDCCRKCCGKTDGVTATGVQAVPYVTCAVDPALIPFGADVIADFGDGELYYLKADDAGVTGGHIDVCVASHAEAVQLGVSRATVYWIGGEEW